MTWLDEAVKLATAEIKCPDCAGGKIMPVQEQAEWQNGDLVYYPYDKRVFLVKDMTICEGEKHLNLYSAIGSPDRWVMEHDSVIWLPFALTPDGNLQIDEMIEKLELELREYNDFYPELLDKETIHPETPTEKLAYYILLCQERYGEPI